MPGQTSVGGEATITDVADEGAFSRMRAHMCLEMALHGERLGAEMANAWPVSRVDALMLGKRAPFGERFSARATEMRPLSGVGSAMNGEVALLGKTLATHAALERPHTRVHPHMDGEAILLGKVLAALAASERTEPTVLAQMHFENGPLRKRLHADVAVALKLPLRPHGCRFLLGVRRLWAVAVYLAAFLIGMADVASRLLDRGCCARDGGGRRIPRRSGRHSYRAEQCGNPVRLMRLVAAACEWERPPLVKG